MTTCEASPELCRLLEWCVNRVAMAPTEVPFDYKYDGRMNVLWLSLSDTWHKWWRYCQVNGLPAATMRVIKHQTRRHLCTQPGQGQFIVPHQTIHVTGGSRYFMGIDLTRGFDAGLDIPDSLKGVVGVVFEFNPQYEEARRRMKAQAQQACESEKGAAAVAD